MSSKSIEQSENVSAIYSCYKITKAMLNDAVFVIGKSLNKVHMLVDL